jgi:hypothetical protein
MVKFLKIFIAGVVGRLDGLFLCERGVVLRHWQLWWIIDRERCEALENILLVDFLSQTVAYTGVGGR